MLRSIRYSSSVAKLWIKHNGCQATEVPTAGCLHVSDFAKVIKLELPRQLSAFDSNQITLHPSLEASALDPDFQLSRIATAGSSAQTPLFVKTITAARKTIYIQDIDENCRPLARFTQFDVANDADLKAILEGRGSALYQLSNPKKGITRTDQLIDGEKYNIYSRYEKSFVDD